MKKIVLILIILNVSLCHASIVDLFNLGKWFNKTNTEIKDLKAGVNDVKAGINDVSLRIGNIEQKLDLSLKMTGQLQGRISAIDKSKNETTSSGRDTITTKTKTTVNESDLMKYIFKIISGIFAGLTLLLWRIIKSKNKLINEERKMFFERLKERDIVIREKDKLIGKILFNMSDDWKEMFKLLRK